MLLWIFLYMFLNGAFNSSRLSSICSFSSKISDSASEIESSKVDSESQSVSAAGFFTDLKSINSFDLILVLSVGWIEDIGWSLSVWPPLIISLINFCLSRDVDSTSGFLVDSLDDENFSSMVLQRWRWFHNDWGLAKVCRKFAVYCG